MKKFTLSVILMVVALTLGAQKADLNAISIFGKRAVTKHHASSTVFNKNILGNNVKMQYLLSADFENHNLPSDWSADNGWEVTNDISSDYFSVPEHTYYVGINDDRDNASYNNQRLVTQSLDLSNVNNAYLYFESYFIKGGSSYGDKATIEISTDGGNTWTELEELDQDDEISDNDKEWKSILIDLSDYAGQSNVKISFLYNDLGNWSYGWAIDNIFVYVAEEHDLAVSGIGPDWGEVNNSVVPYIIISNVGSTEESDFSVRVLIFNDTDTIYDQTKNISNASLVTTTDTLISLDEPCNLLNTGDYYIKGIVSVTNDPDNTNDTLIGNLEVIQVSYANGSLLGYSYITDSIISIDKNSGQLTFLQPSNTDLLLGGDYVDGKVFGVEIGTNNVYLINGDGKTYFYSYITGLENNFLTALAYDPSNSKLFAVALSEDSSLLYNIDDNWQATVIGSITDQTILGLAVDNNGNLYALSAEDTLFSVNPQTGEGTFIGNIGLDIGYYYQDLAFDRETNTLYGALFNYNSQVQAITISGLYSFNTDNGAATLAASFSPQDMVCMLVSISDLGNNSAVTPINNNIIRVYPNPTTGIVNINTDNKIYNLEVIDINGKIVMHQTLNNTNTVNLSSLDAGIYILRLSNKDKVYNIKVIKK